MRQRTMKLDALRAVFFFCGAACAHAALPTGVTVPSALPRHFAIGVTASPDSSGIYGWMPNSGIPWNYAYQYLAGGVNTGSGWANWNTNARFPLYYAQGSAASGYIPVFPYYMLLQSDGPCNGCDENERDLANLNSNSTMAAFYNDFILLMKRLGTGTHDGIQGFGGTAIVHVEPDLHGYAQHAVLNNAGNCFGHCTGQGNDPANLRASVDSSGVAECAGLPNTYVGFNLALIHIRDLYAPNVLMAWHLSNWATFYDISTSTDTTLDVAALGRQSGEFANRCGVAHVRSGISRYDLVFNDVADRDAGYYKYVWGRPNVFWDRANVVLPHFQRWETFTRAFAESTGRAMIVWQIPEGNQYFRTVNNTNGHYQDNRAEYFFAHPQELIDAGVIGLMFGRGNGGSTIHNDDRGDGTTNPAPICTTDGSSTGQICNDHVSTVSDDDGGYIRMAATAYYQNPIDLTGGGGGGNRAPNADAGGDQSVAVNAAVELDASGSSDPDGDSLSYLWEQIEGTAVALSSAATQKPSFTAPGAATTLRFRLTVSDGRLSDADEVEIVVTASGGGPLITQVRSRKGRPGTPAKIIGSGFGTDKSRVKVSFGGLGSSVKSLSPTTIGCKIPKKLKRGSTATVFVEVAGTKSNEVLFRIR